MGEVSTIGLDIAKSVFQVHGVDVAGAVVSRFCLGPDPRRALGPAAIPAASTGRTRDRTRPMLQKRQKVLARAPSTRDPERTLGRSVCGRLLAFLPASPSQSARFRN